MTQATMTYVLNHIRQSIPPEILELAFRPKEFNTTIEQRIISEIIEGPIILDTNLVGGKRREIFLSSSWEMDLALESNISVVGTGVQGSYYKIPAANREHRNISSVIGITPTMVSSLPGSSVNFNGVGSFGNTAGGMLSEMLNTRTFGQYPITPQATLEGTNIIRFYPRQLIEAVAVTVMLEYDSEFINMNSSAIFAMRELCLCATQRYIGTNLRVPVDETEVVAGMEIGAIKDIVMEYVQKGDQYHELLMKLKGAMHYDTRSISRLIHYAL